MTNKSIQVDELRDQIDDMTARLHPTGELDADGKPIYQESRLPLSMIDKLEALIQQKQLEVLERVDSFVLGGVVDLNDIYGNDHRNNYGYNETQVRDAARWIQGSMKAKLNTIKQSLSTPHKKEEEV